MFFRTAQKHNFCRGRLDFASSQISLNSFPRCQRRSRACLSQSEVWAAIFFFFRSAQKNTNLEENVDILLPVKCCRFLVSGFKGEVEYVAANQRLGQPSCFSYRPEKHKLCRWRWDIASCWVLLNSVQKFKVRSRNVSANQRRSGHLDFQMEPKNTNFQEDVEILLPVKFHLILFSGCRGEVENVFQVRDQGDYLLFLIGPKITNFVENVAILLPVKFCWILYINVIGKVENVKSLWRMTVDRQRVVTREERRDLTQSYEKNSYIHRQIQTASWQHEKRHQKLRLHNDCGPT